MAGELVWDKVGEHFYETGVDHGVLYVYDKKNSRYGKGVAWNGLTSITQSPSGADENAQWADNIKYLSLRSVEEFGGTIEAFTYPDEWMVCDGSESPVKGVTIGQQGRSLFGLVYRSIVGNDTEGNDHGYKYHLIYGATASPSERQYQTVNDSPEAATMSWEFTTQPVAITGFKPTALIEIDETKIGEKSENLEKLKKVLFGGWEDADLNSVITSPAEIEGYSTGDPFLPPPDEVLKFLGATIAKVNHSGFALPGVSAPSRGLTDD